MNRMGRRWAGALAGAVGLCVMVGCAGTQAGKVNAQTMPSAMETSEKDSDTILPAPPTVRLVANKPASPPPAASAPPEDPFYDPFAKADEGERKRNTIPGNLLIRKSLSSIVRSTGGC